MSRRGDVAGLVREWSEFDGLNVIAFCTRLHSSRGATGLHSFEVIAGLQLGQLANSGSARHPGAGLPVIGGRSGRKKIGQFEEKIPGEPIHERLIHPPQLGQLQCGRRSFRKSKPNGFHDLRQLVQRIGRQSVGGRRDRRDLENQSQIHGGVPRDGECQSRLMNIRITHAANLQGARVQNGRQRGQPRLVVVLRSTGD